MIAGIQIIQMKMYAESHKQVLNENDKLEGVLFVSLTNTSPVSEIIIWAGSIASVVLDSIPTLPNRIMIKTKNQTV